MVRERLKEEFVRTMAREIVIAGGGVGGSEEMVIEGAFKLAECFYEVQEKRNGEIGD